MQSVEQRDLISTAKDTLLEPTGLDELQIEQVLGQISGPSIDYADLYFQYSRHESWSMEEGTIKSGNYGIEQGVGIRAVSGEKTGFAYSDEFLFPTLVDAANAAKKIAKHTSSIDSLKIVKAETQLAPVLYQPINPLSSLRDEEKIKIIKEVEAVARKYDPRIKEVMVSLAAVQDMILVARSDGLFSADIRPLMRLNVSVIAEQNGRREQASYGGGGRRGYDYLLEDDRALNFAREAARQAIVNLESVDAPAGEMVVVLGPGWPGILLHEAIGHGLEGDFNRKGSSTFSGRIGERVAARGCTVVDDGTLDNRRGSLSIDDEGTPSQNTVLIEDGILKGYMQDTLNARLTGMAPTGNGRRQSFAHLPMPRMTNTYMLPGKYEHEEIIASVDKGIYAPNFGGGQVDITSGKFVFSASEAYLVEKGKIKAPVKGATLIGNGPDVLQRVSMIGNNLELDSGVGNCGKDGQSVPVGVGQPTLRIDGLTVGGVSL